MPRARERLGNQAEVGEARLEAQHERRVLAAGVERDQLALREPASAGERLEVGAVLAAVARLERVEAARRGRRGVEAPEPRLELAHDGRRPDRRRVVEHEQRAQRRDGLAEAVEGAPLELAVERAHARVRLGSELGAELDAEGGAAERGEPREAQGARDWTLTPARSSASRTARATPSAFGLSPCRHRVSAATASSRAVDRPHDAVAGEAHRRLRRGLRVAHDRTRPRAGDEPPGAVVGAIDEGLGRIAQAAGKGGALHRLRSGEADEHEPAARARGAARDRRGELGVVDGLVVERAVRLDVAQRRAVGRGEREQRAHLVEHVGLDLGGRRLDLAAAEAAQVEVARVRADRDARARGERDRAVDHPRVAGVEAAGHVRRGHVLEQGLVGAQRPGSEALAEVRVQVDPQHRRPCGPRALSPSAVAASGPAPS